MLRTLFKLLLWACLFIPTSLSARHYTVVISLDGCRWDYPQWYDTPFLDFMAQRGVSSGLIPSFPSKTFPNHYTLATGLYPSHHGIVANEFLDPKTGTHFSLSDKTSKSNPMFYEGEPIWLTAQKQGLKVSVFYWPGSDVAIQGEYPNHYFKYDKKPLLTFSERIEGIVKELSKPEKQRPDLVMAYFEEPDHSGHIYGPQSQKTRSAVIKMDSLLNNLYNQILRLPYASDINLIIVSDHGMTWIPQEHVVNIAKMLPKRWVKAIYGSIPAKIYAQEGCTDSIYDALRHTAHVQVWKRKDIPAYLHYNDNDRIGDIVVCPDMGYIVYDGPIKAGGAHGFDPQLMDMHALFRAIGPDFKHISLPHFKNVDIYPMLCHLLNITPAPNDGNLEEVKEMLSR